jgi:hypothetical protein
MKLLVCVSLVMIWIAGCAVSGDEPSEQLSVAEQQLAVVLECMPQGETTFAAGACVLTRPSATMGAVFQVAHSENPAHPLRYFWQVPGLQIMSGCKDTQSWCSLHAGNSCSDRQLNVGVQVVDTVTGQSYIDSMVLFIPAVCFTFGRAVFC